MYVKSKQFKILHWVFHLISSVDIFMLVVLFAILKISGFSFKALRFAKSVNNNLRSKN